MKTNFELNDDTSITATREFNAPRDAVWRAYTTPELVRTWLLGPNPETEFRVCEMDIRPGGSINWEWVDSDGVLTITGDVLEVEAPARLVTTETIDGSAMQGMEFPPTTNTVTFEEDNSVTTLRTHMVYASKEVRDGAYSTGMGEGMDVSFDRLADAVGQA